MTDMVEKVARAIDNAAIQYIAAHEEKSRHDPTLIPFIGMADVPVDVLARAAIEAMREPTEDMVKAGDSAIDTESHDGTGITFHTYKHGDARHVFYAMIDAALKPSEP